MYRRRLIQREAAGIPTDAPIVIRVAGEFKWTQFVTNRAIVEKAADAQISHKAGAESAALPAQTIELTNLLRQDIADHIMK